MGHKSVHQIGLDELLLPDCPSQQDKTQARPPDASIPKNAPQANGFSKISFGLRANATVRQAANIQHRTAEPTARAHNGRQQGDSWAVSPS